MIFIKEQGEFIRENALGIGNVELTVRFNEFFDTSFRVSQIKAYKKNHRISSGLDGRFKKGNKSGYLFVKGEHRSAKTEFKKGNIPQNYKQVGSVRSSKDGYLETKIANPGTWRQNHVVLWECHHGAVPKGNKIIFLDGDKANITIENLAIVSDAEMLILNKNKLICNDAELTQSGILIAKVLNVGYRRKSNKTR